MLELRRRDGRLLRVAHKGAAALAPENTLEALERALECGVDLVEVDILALVDGTLVLAHSDNLLELTHGAARGRVGRRTLLELRTLVPKLATLDEALALLSAKAPEVGVHLDVKQRGHEAEIIEAVRRHGIVERTVLSSVDPETLRSLRALEPDVALAFSYPSDRGGVGQRRLLAPVVAGAIRAMRTALPRRIAAFLDAVDVSAAMLHQGVVSAPTVALCHARGVAVFAWTVDEPDALHRVAASGVDGVITNDPRIFSAWH